MPLLSVAILHRTFKPRYMNQPQILRKFEYSTPASSFSPAEYKNQGAKMHADHFPLLKLEIDFEEGMMLMEADWRFLLQANTQPFINWPALHRGRVVIEAEVPVIVPIDLNSVDINELVFPVNGSIKDGFESTVCTGMLIFEKVPDAYYHKSDQTYLCLYLYDLDNETCEIMFRFPVYASSDAMNYN